MTRPKKQWNRITDSQEAADCLYAYMESYTSRQSARWAQAIELKRMCDGDEVGGRRSFPEDLEGTDVEPIYSEPVPQLLNISKQVIDTVISKITSKKNKPQLVVTQGDWEVRRRARKCDRFIEGQFQEPQSGGKFHDLWQVFAHAERIALASTGTAAVKFYSDPGRGKICAEVRDTLSMFVDVTGAVHDAPMWMGEVTWYQSEALIAELEDDGELAKRPELADAIRASAERPADYLGLEYDDDDWFAHFGDRDREVLRVKVVEGWYFQRGKKEGRYIKCIKGAWLEDKPWKHETSPHVFIGGTQALTGFWREPMIKQVASLICHVNDLISGINFSEALTPKKIRYYDPEVHKSDDLVTQDDAVLIPIVGLATGTRPPVDYNPDPYSPMLLELAKFYIQMIHSMLGVSEFQATGNLSGDWSGIALRLLRESFIERISPIHEALITGSVVQASKQIARCAAELLEEDEAEFKSVWRGQGFLQELDADVLKVLDETPYQVDSYAVSEKKNTPEDRVQLIQDLVTGGVVSGDVLLGIIQHYDSFGLLEENDAQRTMLDKQIDKWRMAEPEELAKPDFYLGPPKSIKPEPAIVQLNTAIMQATIDEVSPKRMELFDRYMERLQQIMREKQATMMQLQQAGGAPGQPPGGAPGQPPGGAPMAPAV